MLEFFLYENLFIITSLMLYFFYKDFYEVKRRYGPKEEDHRLIIYLEFSQKFDTIINDLREENMRLKQEIKFHHIEGVIKEEKRSLMLAEAIALKEKNDSERFN